MWSIALLINTNDWEQFQINWLSICKTFLSWHKHELSAKNGYYDALLERISNIQSDPNISATIEITRHDIRNIKDTFDFDDEQEPECTETVKPIRKSIKGRLQPVIPRVCISIF